MIQSGNIKSDDCEMFVETSQMKQSCFRLSPDFWRKKSMNHMKIPSEQLLQEFGKLSFCKEHPDPVKHLTRATAVHKSEKSNEEQSESNGKIISLL